MALQGVYKFCKATGTVLPKEEAERLDHTEKKPVTIDFSLELPSEGRGGWFKFCKTTKTVLPIAEARNRDRWAKDLFTSDEIQPTRHPADGKYYTSQSRFRETTEALGFREVGDAYERGYDPQAESEREIEAKADKRFQESLREHMGAGKEYIKEKMAEYRARAERNANGPEARRVKM